MCECAWCVQENVFAKPTGKKQLSFGGARRRRQPVQQAIGIRSTRFHQWWWGAAHNHFRYINVQWLGFQGRVFRIDHEALRNLMFLIRRFVLKGVLHGFEVWIVLRLPVRPGSVVTGPLGKQTLGQVRVRFIQLCAGNRRCVFPLSM